MTRVLPITQLDNGNGATLLMLTMLVALRTLCCCSWRVIVTRK